MKRMIIVFLALSMLVACVPTPEVDAVKQKDTNVLIDTVLAEEQQREETNATLPPVKAQFPGRFTCDFYTSSSNVHVTADVPIRVKCDGSAFPLARVEHRYLSDEERLAVYKSLLQSDALYIYQQQPRTREDVAKQIQMYMDALDDTPEGKAQWMRETDSTEEDWEQMLENKKRILEQLQKEYNSLPEDVVSEPNKIWDGSLPEDNPSRYDRNVIEVVGSADAHGESWQYNRAQVEQAKEDSAVTYYCGVEDGMGVIHTTIRGSVPLDPSVYDNKQNGASISAQEAAELVMSVLGDVAKDYEISDIYWGNNAALDGDTAGSFDKWGYYVILTQKVQGASVLYSSGSASSGNDDKSDDSVVRFWPYDSITASVDSDGNLMELYWVGATIVTEILSETTTLLPFEKILELVEQQINFEWNGREEFENGSIVIDDVQLGLFRIRERNDMENGLLVPVWFITGIFYFAPENVQYGYDKIPKTSTNPLLIINAIDGTIINSNNGY